MSEEATMAVGAAAGEGLVQRNALVTGAGRGIGQATAVMLAEEGYRVAILSRTASELDETAGLVEEHGREVLRLVADVSDEGQIRRAFQKVQDGWGVLNVLVNNAGAARFSRIEETGLKDWESVLATNLTGVFLCCREAIPLLSNAANSKIVNIASSAGKKGYRSQGAYVAAKHGVMGLSKVLAIELQDRGIRVHAVCPGGVATRLSEDVHPHRDRTGWMQAADVAEVIRFLITRPPNLTIDEVVIRRFTSEVMF